MTLPCAIRVTHPAAKIGFVFARRGLVLEATSSFFLPRLLGTSRALHLATTGAVHAASDPLFDGLFTLTHATTTNTNSASTSTTSTTTTTPLLSPAEVLPRALALAEDAVRNASAVSAVVMRDMLYRGAASPEAAHRLESRLLFDMFRGRDFGEGVRAFLEKREPRMVGTVAEDAPAAWPWWEDELSSGGGEGEGKGAEGAKAKL